MTIGLDLCEDYLAVYGGGEEPVSVWPSVICRDKKTEDWYIGQEAYKKALSGTGVLTEKLFRLLVKDGTSTISRKSYKASDLLTKLFVMVLEDRTRTEDLSCIDRIAVCIHEPKKEIMDKVADCLLQAGIPRERILILSHEEAFVYYMLSGNREFYYNRAALFDLNDEKLSFYEFAVLRGLGQGCAVCEGSDAEDIFRTDILNKESGRTLGDRILSEFARHHMEGKNFSSVFLSGSGFERVDWAPEFTGYICQKRKVMLEKGIFAIGAQKAAEALYLEKPDPYLILCNTRTAAEISAEVLIHEKKSRLILISGGDRWYESGVHAELMPREQNTVDLEISSLDRTKEKRTVRIPLTSFPERPDRTTRVALDLCLTASDQAEVILEDMGFGELFPSSGKRIREELEL